MRPQIKEFLEFLINQPVLDVEREKFRSPL